MTEGLWSMFDTALRPRRLARLMMRGPYSQTTEKSRFLATNASQRILDSGLSGGRSHNAPDWTGANPGRCLTTVEDTDRVCEAPSRSGNLMVTYTRSMRLSTNERQSTMNGWAGGSRTRSHFRLRRAAPRIRSALRPRRAGGVPAAGDGAQGVIRTRVCNSATDKAFVGPLGYLGKRLTDHTCRCLRKDGSYSRPRTCTPKDTINSRARLPTSAI